MFKIRDIVNRLKPVNMVLGIRQLGIKPDSLLGDQRDRIDRLLIKALLHDNINFIAPVELDHLVEGRRDHLMLVQPRAPKQEIERGFQVDDVEFYIEYD